MTNGRILERPGAGTPAPINLGVYGMLREANRSGRSNGLGPHAPQRQR